MRNLVALVACAALIVMLAPGGHGVLIAADREHQQIMADVRMLQEHTMRLQLALSELDQALQVVLGKLDEQAEFARKAAADQRLAVDNVSEGVRILREKLDDSNVRISTLSQEVEALRVSIPPPMPLTTGLTTDPVTGQPLDASPPPAPAAAVPPGMSPQRMYDTAWADYTSGQYSLAIQGFEAYLNTFPRSDLADDAQFHIGQAYFADGQYAEAIAAYEKVLVNYPDGNTVPEASYKRGTALDGLGETDRARQAFELVVRNYPNSTVAVLAQQALDRLNQPSR